jgi:hypothetical protein
MPGAEIANVKAVWSGGVLTFQDVRTGNTIVTLGASTGLQMFAGPTVTTYTAAATLSTTQAGKIVNCTTDAVVFTLPLASTSMAGLSYTIRNTASAGGALLVVRTNATTELICGNGSATGAAICAAVNTKATQAYGDQITLVNSGAVLWHLSNVVGTWAMSTTS